MIPQPPCRVYADMLLIDDYKEGGWETSLEGAPGRRGTEGFFAQSLIVIDGMFHDNSVQFMFFWYFPTISFPCDFVSFSFYFPISRPKGRMSEWRLQAAWNQKLDLPLGTCMNSTYHDLETTRSPPREKQDKRTTYMYSRDIRSRCGPPDPPPLLIAKMQSSLGLDSLRYRPGAGTSISSNTTHLIVFSYPGQTCQTYSHVFRLA